MYQCQGQQVQGRLAMTKLPSMGARSLMPINQQWDDEMQLQQQCAGARITAAATGEQHGADSLTMSAD